MRVKDSMKFYNWIYFDYLEYAFPDKYNKYLKLKDKDIVHS